MKKVRWIVGAVALVALIAGSPPRRPLPPGSRRPSRLPVPDVSILICSDGNTYPNFCYAGCAAPRVARAPETSDRVR